MYKNRILSSIFFDAIPIPILYQMLDSVDARCRFRLIVPSLTIIRYNNILIKYNDKVGLDFWNFRLLLFFLFKSTIRTEEECRDLKPCCDSRKLD